MEEKPLTGGRYIVKDGKYVLVEEATKDHPDGNRARDESGKPISAPDETHANPAKPAEPAPEASASSRRKRGAE